MLVHTWTAAARARAASEGAGASNVIVDASKYTDLEHSWGAMPVVIIACDELQSPCVPQAAGLLAPIIGTSDEQKAAVKLFSNFDEVYRLTTAKRFDDPVLISILKKMRQKGGCTLANAEWEALRSTEVLEARDLEGTQGWFESAYEWSIVTMATVVRCQLFAQHHKTVLFSFKRKTSSSTLSKLAIRIRQAAALVGSKGASHWKCCSTRI